MKIRSKQDWKFQEKDGEKTTGISMTLPDEALTIKEIFERYARGMPLEKRPGFDMGEEDESDIDLEEFNRMDIIDQMEVKAEMEEVVKQDRHQKKKKAWEKEQKERKEKEELQAKKDALWEEQKKGQKEPKND